MVERDLIHKGIKTHTSQRFEQKRKIVERDLIHKGIKTHIHGKAYAHDEREVERDLIHKGIKTFLSGFSFIV